MKVIFTKRSHPPVEMWGQEGTPYFMLYREGKEPGQADELLALCGAFPVFETKAEAELTIEAIQPEHPGITIVPVQVLFNIAAACEMRFGKPAQLVKVERFTE